MQRRFKPVDWSYNSSVYEVNIRQYTNEGTFNAFAAHLARLRDMGIEILWFMPVTPISKEGRLGSLGSYYACSDYTSVNPEFGTLKDFTSLVKKAHKLGFKVIIDWVANHTGLDHTWTKTNPEFYKKDAQGKFYDTNGWEDVIDLNYYDHQLRKAMTDAMEFWVKQCDIDGFRCDMAHLVPLDFWRTARTKLDAIKPLFWLGETEHPLYISVFDSWYAWQWMSATELYYKGEKSMGGLQEVLGKFDTEYPHNAFPLLFTTNHDENSWNGTEYEKYGDAVKVFAVFNCTWNGLPLIYSGQELPNYKRLKFFEKDPIEWKEPVVLHDFYKSLLHLRQNNPALQAGQQSKPQLITTNLSEHVLAYIRRNGDHEVLVLLNFSPHQHAVHLPKGIGQGSYTSLFEGKKITVNSSNPVPLDGWGYVVYSR